MGHLGSKTARAAVTAGLAVMLSMSSVPTAAFADLASDSAAAQSQAATTEASAQAQTGATDAATTGAATAGETATDARAAGTFTANGESFDTFVDALAEASKAADKTVTVNASTADNLTVDGAYEGVTVTAAEGVELHGSLTISAKNVTVKGIHFVLDDTSTANLSVKANNGTTVTGCTFDITGTRKGQFNAIWAAYVQDLTFEDNTFNIAVNVQDNSWVGINLVGNGTNVVKNVKINNNTLNGRAPVNDTWNADGKAPNLFLVIANGNVKDEGGYGIENLTATGNKTFDKTGVAQPNTLVYGISFNNVNGATFENNSFEGYMGFAYTGWPNQASSKGVTIRDNTLDTRVGILLRDTDVAEGELTLKDNTFGDKNEIPFSGNGVTTAVAVVDQDGKTYSSVQKAVDAGATTVTMLQDSTEDVTVPAGRTLTLDLAGRKLTNASGDTITNNGTLTVTDSSADKAGVVDNVTNAKAPLVNEEGATATLTGGTFRRSAENSADNSYYVLVNHGTMTIEAPTKVEAKNADGTLASKSSLIDNGWASGSPAKGASATLTINGGSFEGGNYIKNDSYGELTINGGTVRGSSAAVFNWNKAIINGGDFSAATGKQVIWNGGNSADRDPDGANVGQLTISGGTFSAADGQTTVGQYKGNLTDGQENSVSVEVSGGTFSGALADDLVNAQVSGGSFTVAPKVSYVVADSGLVQAEDGTWGVAKAHLTLTDAVVDGVWTRDVVDGKVSAADLAGLAMVDVKGYTVAVDAADVDAINAAIAAGDLSKTFEVTLTATKDGAPADSTDVLTATFTVKLTDSTPAPKPEGKTWKVTFVDGLDSTEDAVVKVEDGQTVAKPADPAYDGWTFVGWFTTLSEDGTLSDPYDFSTPVDADLTLYAGWVEKTDNTTDGKPEEKPEDGGEPENGGEPDKQLPQTGDDTNYVVPAVLGAAGAAAIGGALVMRRRRQ